MLMEYHSSIEVDNSMDRVLYDIILGDMEGIHACYTKLSLLGEHGLPVSSVSDTGVILVLSSPFERRAGSDR